MLRIITEDLCIDIGPRFQVEEGPLRRADGPVPTETQARASARTYYCRKCKQHMTTPACIVCNELGMPCEPFQQSPPGMGWKDPPDMEAIAKTVREKDEHIERLNKRVEWFKTSLGQRDAAIHKLKSEGFRKQDATKDDKLKAAAEVVTDLHRQLSESEDKRLRLKEDLKELRIVHDRRRTTQRAMGTAEDKEISRLEKLKGEG